MIVEEKPPLDDALLMHYGVKGMKWGERKTYKAAQRRFKEIEPEVNRRQAQRRYDAALSEEQYKMLSNKDFVVAKGSVVKRTTADPTVGRDPLYLSTNEQDATNYRGLAPSWNTGGKVAKKHEDYYEVTLQATKNLRSPSEKARVDGYIRLMDANEIKLNTGETINGREFLRRQGLGDLVNTMSSREMALTYYGQLSATQGIRNEPLNTAYFNSLKKKGYNAIIDDNDRGVLSKTPLLALDPHGTLKSVHVDRLSSAQVHEAQASIKLPNA